MAKKKLVVVKGWGDNPYRMKSVGFSLVSSPKEGRKQCFEFVTCRDYVSDAVRAHVLDDGSVSPHYKPGMHPKIDMSKTRLLIVRDFDSDGEKADFKARLFSGKRAVNLYEKIAGWSESKITTVNHSDKSHAWLLTGPKEWMTYSNLLSMVTLILRVTSQRLTSPIEFTGEKELQKVWRNVVDGHMAGHDNSYLRTCYPWFPVLMRNYKTIFNQSLREAYQEDRGHYHGVGWHQRSLFLRYRKQRAHGKDEKDRQERKSDVTLSSEFYSEGG